MNQKETLKQSLQLIKPYWFYLVLSLIFAIISVILTLYVPILIGKCIDLIVGPNAVYFNEIMPILIQIIFLVIATSFSTWLMNLCNNKMTQEAIASLRYQAFSKLHELPLGSLDSKKHGDTISRIIIDVDQFSEGMLLGFSQVFTGLITIVGTLLFMIRVNMTITIVVVLVTPVSLFVARFIAKRTYDMFKLQSITRGYITSLVEELVGNQRIVKAFGYEQEAEKRFNELNQELRECGQKAIFYSSITNPCTRFVNGLVYTGVGIFGAMAALRGLLSIGQLSAFLTYANQYTKPFNELSGVISELQNALASASRVFDFIAEESRQSDVANAKILPISQVNGEVLLRNISFSYSKDKKLIENLNLNVKKGQRIAIVGPTGCGKTTLINLLMRFYDVNDGEIVVSGHPIKSLTRNSLRRSYGMVLQDTWLRSGTIRENIAYGNPDATEEEIIIASKAARIHSFIKRLPDGYDTVISENGDNISQGQKQLLCIARVMLCLPPMLILDEATSSIDTMTEIRIQQAFSKMMEGRTSFIVAHRLSTIKEADVILVMKDGLIIEQGRHAELLEKNGFYSKLYHSQFAI